MLIVGITLVFLTILWADSVVTGGELELYLSFISIMIVIEATCASLTFPAATWDR